LPHPMHEPEGNSAHAPGPHAVGSYVPTLASGAVYGCPPRVRTSRKSIYGLMRQPANGRNCFAGFAAARMPPRHGLSPSVFLLACLLVKLMLLRFVKEQRAS